MIAARKCARTSDSKVHTTEFHRVLSVEMDMVDPKGSKRKTKLTSCLL